MSSHSAVSPVSARATFANIRSHEHGGRIAEAIFVLRAYLAHTPDDVFGWTWLSELYLRRRETERAHRAALRALMYDPAWPHALGIAAHTALTLGDAAGARTFAERALRIAPTNGRLAHALAQAHEELGDHVAAARASAACLAWAARHDATALPVAREARCRLLRMHDATTLPEDLALLARAVVLHRDGAPRKRVMALLGRILTTPDAHHDATAYARVLLHALWHHHTRR